jgi:dGTPase
VSTGYTALDEQRYAPDAPKESARRTAFARDRARVLHCAALRRLAAKTQVLAAGESDIPRTRLTHTLEVAQVAREMGAALGADPDLVEVAALAHDIGHPPFGHNGEEALHAVSTACGGFEGNAQSFRVLTRLEAKIDLDDRSVGLNLTRAALDAATKYPWPARPGQRKFGVYQDDLPVFTWMRQGAPPEVRCLEAQIMDWADDVAYSVHDVEDAVVLGHLDLAALGSAHERAEVVANARRLYALHTDEAVLAAALDRLLALPAWPGSFDGSHRAQVRLKALTSTLIGRFSLAAQHATTQRHGPGPLRRYDAGLVVPDPVRAEVAVMKAVAATYVMHRPEAAGIYTEQRRIVQELVSALVLRSGQDLDPPLQEAWQGAGSDAARLRVIIDQVASLTDTSVRRWHRRLCA